MSTTAIKALPFTVCLDRAASLGDQVAAGVRRAIQAGFYGPGERLPGIEETAAQLGISHMPVRTAFRQLAADGDIVARRGRHGIRVRDTGNYYWRAHLLFVHFAYATYYFSARSHRLEAALTASRVRVTTVLAKLADASRGFPQVTTPLENEHIDLGIVAGPSAPIAPFFAQHGIPLIAGAEAGETHPGAVASWLADDTPSVEELARLCAGAGVPAVAMIGPARPETAALARALAAGGAICASQPMAPPPGVRTHMALEQFGWDATMKFLAVKGRRPELLYFSDDFVARGGLAAILASGVRVPEALQLVTHCNAGDVPFFPIPLTRVEADPEQHADAMASLAIKALADPHWRQAAPLRVPSRLVLGETTRFQ